jgi:hypothetical protein
MGGATPSLLGALHGHGGEAYEVRAVRVRCIPAGPAGRQRPSRSQRAAGSTAECGAQCAIIVQSSYPVVLSRREDMLSTQHKFSIGYSLLTILGVLLIHTVFFAPQSENLSYHDFKTLLKAGKILDLTLGERIITGRLTIDGLDGLLPLVQMEAFRKFG